MPILSFPILYYLLFLPIFRFMRSGLISVEFVCSEVRWPSYTSIEKGGRFAFSSYGYGLVFLTAFTRIYIQHK